MSRKWPTASAVMFFFCTYITQSLMYISANLSRISSIENVTDNIWSNNYRQIFQYWTQLKTLSLSIAVTKMWTSEIDIEVFISTRLKSHFNETSNINFQYSINSQTTTYIVFLLLFSNRWTRFDSNYTAFRFTFDKELGLSCKCTAAILKEADWPRERRFQSERREGADP